jgi:hypothetical protein
MLNVDIDRRERQAIPAALLLYREIVFILRDDDVPALDLAVRLVLCKLLDIARNLLGNSRISARASSCQFR